MHLISNTNGKQISTPKSYNLSTLHEMQNVIYTSPYYKRVGIYIYIYIYIYPTNIIKNS